MIIRGLGMTFCATKNLSLCLFPPYLVYAICKMIMTLLKSLNNFTSLSASYFYMIQNGKICIQCSNLVTLTQFGFFLFIGWVFKALLLLKSIYKVVSNAKVQNNQAHTVHRKIQIKSVLVLCQRIIGMFTLNHKQNSVFNWNAFTVIHLHNFA